MHISRIDVVWIFEEFLITGGPVIRKIVARHCVFELDVVVADLLEGKADKVEQLGLLCIQDFLLRCEPCTQNSRQVFAVAGPHYNRRMVVVAQSLLLDLSLHVF